MTPLACFKQHIVVQSPQIIVHVGNIQRFNNSTILKTHIDWIWFSEFQSEPGYDVWPTADYDENSPLAFGVSKSF